MTHEFIPLSEDGESPFAYLGSPARTIVARWREHKVIYHQGWGDPTVRLWTLWLDGKRFTVLEGGKPVEHFYMPDGAKELQGRELGPGRWEVDFESYHTAPTGNESAVAKRRLTFDLEKMEARHELIEIKHSD
jgi:hypothetical protein